MENILFIDGRNFISLAEEVIGKADFSIYDFEGLFKKALSDLRIDRKVFYIGKLQLHKDTADKSKRLIEKQRRIKNHLESQDFEVVVAGRVRGQMERGPFGRKILTFKEKGVDVKIAIDMVATAYDKKLQTAILCSSDSDLQPAISELKNRGIAIVYLGFENCPNKGLMYTTNRSILIRNSELKEFAKRR